MKKIDERNLTKRGDVRDGVRTIHVQWEGPLDGRTAKSCTRRPADFGVYQVYGSHPVYGLNTLLYVGRAADQTFGERLRKEEWLLEGEHGQGECTFFLGRLAGSKTPDDIEWGIQISDVESLLILAHKPSYNCHGIKGLGDKSEKRIGDLRVLNWGTFGVLLPEVSAARWTRKLSDVPNYNVYGQHPGAAKAPTAGEDDAEKVE